MAKINWTLEAENWLRDIYFFIAQDNPNIAEKVIDGIIEKTEVLITFPELGFKYSQNENVRILLYGHYRIAYIIKENNDIDILGIFHGALDFEKYLPGS